MSCWAATAENLRQALSLSAQYPSSSAVDAVSQEQRTDPTGHQPERCRPLLVGHSGGSALLGYQGNADILKAVCENPAACSVCGYPALRPNYADWLFSYGSQCCDSFYCQSAPLLSVGGIHSRIPPPPRHKKNPRIMKSMGVSWCHKTLSRGSAQISGSLSPAS